MPMMLLRQAVVLNAWLLCIQMTNGSTLPENWEDHVNSFNLDDYVGDVPEGYQYEDEHMSFTPLEGKEHDMYDIRVLDTDEYFERLSKATDIHDAQAEMHNDLFGSPHQAAAKDWFNKKLKLRLAEAARAGQDTELTDNTVMGFLEKKRSFGLPKLPVCVRHTCPSETDYQKVLGDKQSCEMAKKWPKNQACVDMCKKKPAYQALCTQTSDENSDKPAVVSWDEAFSQFKCSYTCKALTQGSVKCKPHLDMMFQTAAAQICAIKGCTSELCLEAAKEACGQRPGCSEHSPTCVNDECDDALSPLLQKSKPDDDTTTWSSAAKTVAKSLIPNLSTYACVQLTFNLAALGLPGCYVDLGVLGEVTMNVANQCWGIKGEIRLGFTFGFKLMGKSMGVSVDMGGSINLEEMTPEAAKGVESVFRVNPGENKCGTLSPFNLIVAYLKTAKSQVARSNQVAELVQAEVDTTLKAWEAKGTMEFEHNAKELFPNNKPIKEENAPKDPKAPDAPPNLVVAPGELKDFLHTLSAALKGWTAMTRHLATFALERTADYKTMTPSWSKITESSTGRYGARTQASKKDREALKTSVNSEEMTAQQARDQRQDDRGGSFMANIARIARKAKRKDKKDEAHLFYRECTVSVANMFVRIIDNLHALWGVYFAEDASWSGDCNVLPARFHLPYEESGKTIKFSSSHKLKTKGIALGDKPGTNVFKRNDWVSRHPTFFGEIPEWMVGTTPTEDVPSTIFPTVLCAMMDSFKERMAVFQASTGDKTEDQKLSYAKLREAAGLPPRRLEPAQDPSKHPYAGSKLKNDREVVYRENIDFQIKETCQVMAGNTVGFRPECEVTEISSAFANMFPKLMDLILATGELMAAEIRAINVCLGNPVDELVVTKYETHQKCDTQKQMIAVARQRFINVVTIYRFFMQALGGVVTAKKSYFHFNYDTFKIKNPDVELPSYKDTFKMATKTLEDMGKLFPNAEDMAAPDRTPLDAERLLVLSQMGSKDDLLKIIEKDFALNFAIKERGSGGSVLEGDMLRFLDADENGNPFKTLGQRQHKFFGNDADRHAALFAKLRGETTRRRQGIQYPLVKYTQTLTVRVKTGASNKHFCKPGPAMLMVAAAIQKVGFTYNDVGSIASCVTARVHPVGFSIMVDRCAISPSKADPSISDYTVKVTVKKSIGDTTTGFVDGFKEMLTAVPAKITVAAGAGQGWMQDFKEKLKENGSKLFMHSGLTALTSNPISRLSGKFMDFAGGEGFLARALRSVGSPKVESRLGSFMTAAWIAKAVLVEFVIQAAGNAFAGGDPLAFLKEGTLGAAGANRPEVEGSFLVMQVVANLAVTVQNQYLPIEVEAKKSTNDQPLEPPPTRKSDTPKFVSLRGQTHQQHGHRTRRAHHLHNHLYPHGAAARTVLDVQHEMSRLLNTKGDMDSHRLCALRGLFSELEQLAPSDSGRFAATRCHMPKQAEPQPGYWKRGYGGVGLNVKVMNRFEMEVPAIPGVLTVAPVLALQFTWNLQSLLMAVREIKMTAENQKRRQRCSKCIKEDMAFCDSRYETDKWSLAADVCIEKSAESEKHCNHVTSRGCTAELRKHKQCYIDRQTGTSNEMGCDTIEFRRLTQSKLDMKAPKLDTGRFTHNI